MYIQKLSILCTKPIIQVQMHNNDCGLGSSKKMKRKTRDDSTIAKNNTIKVHKFKNKYEFELKRTIQMHNVHSAVLAEINETQRAQKQN